MPGRPTSSHSGSYLFKADRPDSSNIRYDRYRISTKCVQPWSETRKMLTIAALTAMLAEESRVKSKPSSSASSVSSGSTGSSSSSSSSSGRDWDVCHIRFSVSNGKSKPGASEVFRKVDSRLQWIDSPRNRR